MPRAAIIGLVQVKGGAGRSTIATNLAGELSRFQDVALLDCDLPQATSASWAALREQAGQAGRLQADTVRDHRELVNKVEALERKVGAIILDGPPRLAEMSRAIILLSDLCLVPVSASAAEVWATSDLLVLIEDARKMRKVNARLLWTRFRAHTRLAQELAAEADKALKLQALKSALGYRVAYPEALGLGRTAAEMGDPEARNEVVGLVAEIRRMLR